MSFQMLQNLVLRHIGGVDEHRTFRTAQRSDLPRAVDTVPLAYPRQNVLEGHGLAPSLQLQIAPAGSSLRGGRHEKFQGRLGKDYASHIAPLRNQGTVPLLISLEVQQGLSQTTQRRVGRDDAVHMRSPYRVTYILPVHQDPLAPQLDRNRSQRPPKFFRFRGGNAPPIQRKGKRTINCPRIEITNIQPPGQPPGHGTLSRPGRAVDRQDPSHA